MVALRTGYKVLNRALLFSGFALLLLVCTTRASSAATLVISPATISVHVGDTFSATVYVSSPGEAMNAASGIIAFPTDTLAVRSISKTGSIISYWTHDPSFSNTNGTVNFEGVAFNPGYTGSAGKIISISFRAVEPGVANISFSSGTVLANDGQGTNILDRSAGSVVTITAAPAAVPIPATTPTPQKPTAPVATSSAPLLPGPVQLTLPNGATTTVPQFTIQFTSSDDASGLDRYDIAIDGNIVAHARVSDAGTPYMLTLQHPGSGTLSVTAYDKAGNSSSASTNFDYEPQATASSSGIYLVIALVILSLVILLLFFWILALRRTHHAVHRVRRTHALLHERFSELKEAVAHEVHALEGVKSKRDLTLEEERLINRLKKLVDKYESAIEKEIA